MKIEKPVVHISLNPHPEDVLTDIELQLSLIHISSLSFFLSLSFEQTGYPPPVDKVSGMAPCRS